MSPDRDHELTIRMLGEHDRTAIQRLAQRDSARAPALPALGAEAGGRLIAAVSLAGADPAVIADPFLPTAEAAELLRVRARQLRSEPSTGRRRSRRRRRARAALAGSPPGGGGRLLQI